ncbi:MAG TPA: hypothetical protein VGD60_14780 [Candidatus Acidoferrales bacterium]
MKWRFIPALAFSFFFFTAVTGSAFAQQEFAPAPIPSAIRSAKTAFISNASGQSIMPPGTSDLAYNEFYAAIKTWGRYQLVGSPADADLILEIRFLRADGGDFEFRATVFEKKTHTILWAFSQSVPQSANTTKSRQLFDQAMRTLVDHLEQLAA